MIKITKFKDVPNTYFIPYHFFLTKVLKIYTSFKDCTLKECLSKFYKHFWFCFHNIFFLPVKRVQNCLLFLNARDRNLNICDGFSFFEMDWLENRQSKCLFKTSLLMLIFALKSVVKIISISDNICKWYSHGFKKHHMNTINE